MKMKDKIYQLKYILLIDILAFARKSRNEMRCATSNENNNKTMEPAQIKKSPPLYQRGLNTFYFWFTENSVSHISAVHPQDGRTCLHYLIESSDNATILAELLQLDTVVANIQDHEGLAAIHLACKLKRKACVQTLVVSIPWLFCLIVFFIINWKDANKFFR